MAGDNAKRSFDGTLVTGHKQAAVEVPFDPAIAWSQPAATLWPGRRGHRVHVHAGDVEFDSAIVSRSRRHWLLVDDEVRFAAGWHPGDRLQLIVNPQGGPAA